MSKSERPSFAKGVATWCAGLTTTAWLLLLTPNSVSGLSIVAVNSDLVVREMPLARGGTEQLQKIEVTFDAVLPNADVYYGAFLDAFAYKFWKKNDPTIESIIVYASLGNVPDDSSGAAGNTVNLWLPPADSGELRPFVEFDTEYTLSYPTSALDWGFGTFDFIIRSGAPVPDAGGSMSLLAIGIIGFGAMRRGWV